MVFGELSVERSRDNASHMKRQREICTHIALALEMYSGVFHSAEHQITATGFISAGMQGTACPGRNNR